jgi:hypothetical protein
MLEVEVEALRDRNTKLFWERVMELLFELRDYRIKRLCMVNGDWWFEGDAIEFINEIGSPHEHRGTVPLRVLGRWIDPHEGDMGQYRRPTIFRQKHRRHLAELAEILNFVNDERNLHCFCIEESEIVAYQKYRNNPYDNPKPFLRL